MAPQKKRGRPEVEKKRVADEEEVDDGEEEKEEKANKPKSKKQEAGDAAKAFRNKNRLLERLQEQGKQLAMKLQDNKKAIRTTEKELEEFAEVAAKAKRAANRIDNQRKAAIREVKELRAQKTQARVSAVLKKSQWKNRRLNVALAEAQARADSSKHARDLVQAQVSAANQRMKDLGGDEFSREGLAASKVKIKSNAALEKAEASYQKHKAALDVLQGKRKAVQEQIQKVKGAVEAAEEQSKAPAKGKKKGTAAAKASVKKAKEPDEEDEEEEEEESKAPKAKALKAKGKVAAPRKVASSGKAAPMKVLKRPAARR